MYKNANHIKACHIDSSSGKLQLVPKVDKAFTGQNFAEENSTQ